MNLFEGTRISSADTIVKCDYDEVKKTGVNSGCDDSPVEICPISLQGYMTDVNMLLHHLISHMQMRELAIKLNCAHVERYMDKIIFEVFSLYLWVRVGD